MSPALGERRLNSAISERPGPDQGLAEGPVLAAAVKLRLEVGLRDLAAALLHPFARRGDELLDHSHLTRRSLVGRRPRSPQQAAQAARSAAPESIASAALLDARREALGDAADVDRGAGVEQDEVAPGALPRRRARRGRPPRSPPGVPPATSSSSASARPNSPGSTNHSSVRAVGDLDHPRAARRSRARRGRPRRRRPSPARCRARPAPRRSSPGSGGRRRRAAGARPRPGWSAGRGS